MPTSELLYKNRLEDGNLHSASCTQRDKMGNLFNKPSNYDPTERICQLTKIITTAHGYDNTITEMFEDGIFSRGRVEVWYIASCAVHNHLPVDQHPMLDDYFWKWMSVFVDHLPHEMQ